MCNFMAKYKQKNPSIIIDTAVEPNSPNDAIAVYIDTHIYSNSQFEVLNSQHPSLVSCQFYNFSCCQLLSEISLNEVELSFNF